MIQISNCLSSAGKSCVLIDPGTKIVGTLYEANSELPNKKVCSSTKQRRVSFQKQVDNGVTRGMGRGVSVAFALPVRKVLSSNLPSATHFFVGVFGRTL